MDALTDTKTEKVAEIIRTIYPRPIPRLLVVGCGDGIEAAILADHLGAKVTGIDVADSFDPRASEAADLRLGDAMKLDFENEAFDFVFSYHALEHIPDPNLALRRNASRPKIGWRFLDRNAESYSAHWLCRSERGLD